MLQLQRAAGNAAVSRLVAGLEPVAISRAANGEGQTVQRAGGDPAGWEAPADLGFISDRGSAVAAINGVLLKEAVSYQDVQAAGVADQSEGRSSNVCRKKRHIWAGKARCRPTTLRV